MTHDQVSVEQLMMQLIDRAQEVVHAQERFRGLLIANQLIVQELSLPALLQRILVAARELVQARYAALGVLAPDGSLEQFLHVGLEQEIAASIPELPKGRGLLGALIETAEPIRLRRISEDERSFGFPPGHPVMTSFLGVPIRSRSQVFGNLYLTDHEGGEFSAEDQELVTALAATAGVAIENARLYGDARHRQRWLEASSEITNALLDPADDRDPLQLIADAVRRLAEADVVDIVLRASKPGLLCVAVASGVGAEELPGVHYPAANSLVELALQTGRGMRIASIDDQDHHVHLRQVTPVQAVMVVPLSGRSGPQGAIVLGWHEGRRGFASAELETIESFASHAAVARELALARSDQERLTVLEDRDRIARDLHDHVIQRLFGAGLTLQSAQTLCREESTSSRLCEVVDQLDETIRQIRTSIFQLRQHNPADPGVRSAVLTVIDEVTRALGFRPAVRFAGPLDTAVTGSLSTEAEAVVREALTNVARHAHASEVVVDMEAADGRFTISVVDDGVGIPTTVRRSGLANLEERAHVHGGSFTVMSHPGAGTRLAWSVPLP